ncbi:unnamed protein product [Prunus brigantina]
MKEELKSMDKNHVWTLVQPSSNAKPIGCKWVYKTKRDSKGQIERLKPRLMAKGFTQREGFEYTETFSPVSSKDSFRIIMALIAHFNLELHQMDVRTAFLNVSGSKFIFLVLYVNDILLASSDFQLLKSTKEMLSISFDMKDMGEAHFVLGIEILRDISRCLLGLSQKSYIEKVLKRFKMEKCSKLNKSQSPANELENEQMKLRPYASLVGSIMYAQVCTRPDLAFVVSVLGRFQANPGEPHWVATKKVLRYLQGTKSHMLIYSKVEKLEIVAYTDSDLAGCTDDRKSTAGYVFVLASGAVSWKSAKQTVVATSTMEAEFIGCFEATKQAV